MLYNQDFLNKLTQDRNKTIYARVIALTFDELPIESIEGRVSAGSITFDGTSAVRRTCSLTLLAQDYDYSNYSWGLNTKFKLEIGVKNNVDSSYPDIIWFKQGLYLITAFNTSRSTSGFTINITGKDKMCMLNGEVGGNIVASVDWSTEEVVDTNGDITYNAVPIKTIIRNAVSQFGGEPLHNIIINDLPDYGLELMEYRYDVPLYLYRLANGDESQYENAIIENDNADYTWGGKSERTLAEMDNNVLEMLVDSSFGNRNTTPTSIYVKGPDDYYYFAKIAYGQTAGYHKTDLVYCGDLISSAGDTVVTVLDKITSMLSEFEYFYDLDGHFVFQQKASSVKTLTWDNTGFHSTISTLTEKNEKYSYMFNNGELITAFSNTPDLSNLKNDFSIWGEKEGVADTIAIHLRYAIDEKPTKYVSPYATHIIKTEYNETTKTENYVYLLNEDGTKFTDTRTYIASDTTDIKREVLESEDGKDPIYWSHEWYCDWREILYQMAQDYYAHNQDDDFAVRIAKANPQWITGRTGYEQYYVDIIGFWRELYAPLEVIQKQVNSTRTDSNQIVWNSNGWNSAVSEAPDTLVFWFDFLDSADGELSQYSVKKIGSRTKVVNESSVKGIYFRDTPSILYYTADEIAEGKADKAGDDGYKVINCGQSIDTMFSISTQGTSAISKLNDLLYQHSYCIESTSITSIPIYYLEPNTRVYIHDDKTSLDGDYIVNRVTIPLVYNGTMSITATKAVEDIIS